MKNNSQVHAIAAVDPDFSFKPGRRKSESIDPGPIKVNLESISEAITTNISSWSDNNHDWFSAKGQPGRDYTKEGKRFAQTKTTFSGSCFGEASVEYKADDESKNFAKLFMDDQKLKSEMEERIHWLYKLHHGGDFHLTNLVQVVNTINFLSDTLYQDQKDLSAIILNANFGVKDHQKIERIHFLFDENDPNKLTVTMVAQHYHTGLYNYNSLDSQTKHFAKASDLTEADVNKYASHSGNEYPLFHSIFQQTFFYHPNDDKKTGEFSSSDPFVYVVFHHGGLYNAIKDSINGPKRFKNVWMPKHEQETCLWQSSAAKACDPLILIEELKKESTELSLQHTSNKGLSVEASMKTEGRNSRIVSPAYRLPLRLKLVIGMFSILCVYLFFLASGSHPLVMFSGFQSFSDIRAIALIGLSIFGLYRLYSKPDNKHLYLVLKMILALFPLFLATCLVLTHGVPASLLVLSNARITSEIIVVASMMVATCISFVLFYKDFLDCCKFCHIVSDNIYGADKRETQASTLRADAAQKRMVKNVIATERSIGEENAGANYDMSDQQFNI